MLKFKYNIFTFAFIHLSLLGIIGNNYANEIISMYPVIVGITTIQVTSIMMPMWKPMYHFMT